MGQVSCLTRAVGVIDHALVMVITIRNQCVIKRLFIYLIFFSFNYLFNGDVLRHFFVKYVP